MSGSTSRPYPLAEQIPKEKLDSEAALLDTLYTQPYHIRLLTFLRLGGPGFMGAALTLGAGTLTAAMLSGAQFGYKTLWISWVAIGSGLFMMAAMARFTTQGQFRLIDVQAKHHGFLVARVLTAFIGIVCVALAFNFGQVALGTHLIESLAGTAGISFPQQWNWPLYGLVTAWIALSYGRGGGRGVLFVENFMKLSLGTMLLCFATCLLVVGIDWSAAAKGFFIPWLPRGAAGIDLFIASSAAAIGVMDWVFFHYAGHAKGWGPRHENLARVDMITGLALPFLLINFVVVSVFAATLFGSSQSPETAQQLASALVPLLGETGASYAFLIGFLAVPITTTVGMSIACAVGVHEMMGWDPDVRSWRWKLSILAPQIGLFAAFAPSPIFLIIIIAAALSLSNNIVSWSFFLLLNDSKVMGENRSRSYCWNLGILVQVTLLNGVAIMWILNRFGLWG
ncbi:MAG: divalent metal cation transporter [Pseudomonadota bacterium]